MKRPFPNPLRNFQNTQAHHGRGRAWFVSRLSSLDSRLLSLMVLFAALLILTLSPAAWSQPGRITGTVTDADTGEPLIGASVEVIGPGLAGKTGGMSGAEGRYAVENVPTGTYRVKVTFVGYREATVKDVRVVAGASVGVDFQIVAAPYELGEIVVSASRRSENIVDAPMAISKIDAREAQRNTSANSIASLIENVKGIDYTQRGIYTEKFNARGFNTAAGTSSRIVMRMDGVPWSLSSPAWVLALPVPKDDLQDVEIIVGPGSALYGPDAVAGIVSVTTKDPRGSQGTTVALSGGYRHIFKGRFRHAGTQGKWGWKVAGEYLRARDFEIVNTFYNADSSKSVTDDPDFNTRSFRGRLGLFYYPNADSKISFQDTFHLQLPLGGQFYR